MGRVLTSAVAAGGMLCLLAAELGGQTARAGGGAAVGLAESLQRRYDGVRDFSADFVQSYRGGVLKRQVTERGRLEIKKPGKMRWEYSAPEKKTFVSDGQKVFLYIPSDKQVVVTDAPRDDSPAAPTLFLAGKGNIVRDFTSAEAAVPSGFAADSRALKLVPRTRQAEYEWLILVVDAKSLILRGLVSVDPQGGTSSFTFANLKENVGISDRTFVFEKPRGVDIVTAADR